MCGIFALVNTFKKTSTQPLQKGTEVISHRGPDDEGYLLWNGADYPKVFAGKDTHAQTVAMHMLQPLPETENWKIGFGHRRLSIIDTTPHGHQPMKLDEAGLFITYNGEVYNYLELKEELILKGHHFNTHSDTEVILHAWAEWGTNCLQKFNGMFAFVLLDTKRNQLYAVRDRFGIKPLYYSISDDLISFASEVKQIRVLPGFEFELNEDIIYDYLAHGFLDHSSQTFDKNIFQLRGGEMAIVNIQDNTFKVDKWYELVPEKWTGSNEEAEDQFRMLFKDSVRLRLRADVPIGSCLSGGLDSSAIVCQVSDLLNNELGVRQETVTACFEEAKFDEWGFAEKVINQTGAKPHQVWPTSDKLIEDLDKLLWHMDEPFGSTSQFSQWCVFEGASKAGLKVMLDGQGADEQLAGYGGNDVPLYSGLLKKGKFRSLYKNYKGFHREMGYPPKGQLLHGLKRTLHIEKKVNDEPKWLKIRKSTSSLSPPTLSLQEEMIQQLTITSIPALLRYEDRNSMAFSIESRVPFLDHRLVEFVLGLPEEQIYHLGIRKVILRNALSELLPPEISERKDKMGFVTPEEVWLKDEKPDWFRNNMKDTKTGKGWFVEGYAEKIVDEMIDERKKFTFEPWRILCFRRWLTSM